MAKLVIFDFDGLIVNSEFVVFEAIRDVLDQYNQCFTWEYFSRYIGMSVVESLKIFYRDCHIPIPFEIFLYKRNKNVELYLEERLELMPGILSLLNNLRKRQVPLAIATSGDRKYLLHHLERLAILNYFSFITCIDDVKQGKPHPDLVLKVLELAKIAPSDAIMLEDSPHGIEAANRAGVYSIAIPSRGVSYDRFIHADCICKDIESFGYFTELLY